MGVDEQCKICGKKATGFGGGQPARIAEIPVCQQAKTNVYTGAYRHNVTCTWTIEMARSEAAAKERYGQLVLEKQNAGCAPQTGSETNSPVFGDVKASWFGSKVNSAASTSCFGILYAYNTDIKKWVTAAYFIDSSSFEGA